MGGCVSVYCEKAQPKPHKRQFGRFRKRHGKITTSIPDVSMKRLSDAGSHVTDFAVSEYVHLDFEKGASTTCKRSDMSNMTFHLTQLQWNHSQIDVNGLFYPSLVFTKFPITIRRDFISYISVHPYALYNGGKAELVL